MFEFVKKIFPGNKQEINLYQSLGEEKGIQTLVFKFYDVMENDPVARECLAVHALEDGKVPVLVKEKLVQFLTGWLGGPQLFIEKYGHPRMRARHIHIPITSEHAGQWIYCMESALNKHPSKLKNKNKVELMNSFKALSLRIINS